MRKLLIIICVLFFLTGCGSELDESCIDHNERTIEYWHELPAYIYVEDESLVSATGEAVEAINDAVGFVLDFADNFGNSNIVIKCDSSIRPDGGDCYNSYGSVEGIIASEVLIDCDASRIPKVVAHELWHSLGFRFHYCNYDCLNSVTMNESLPLKDLFCLEMIEDFGGQYDL